MKILLLLLTLPLVLPLYGQGKIIFQENFDKYPQSADLSKLGWRVASRPGHSSYTVRDGKLYVAITPHELRDGYAEIDVPLCRKGQIDFDVMVDPERRGERGIGMTLDLYNISTFWHDYCRDWRLYFPEPVAKRMTGFKTEPVGHKSIGKVKRHKWLHYRICFDTDKDRVECYVGDMKDPAYIKGDAAVLGRAEYQGGKLRIGSFGVCTGKYQTVVDNIVVRSFDEQSTAAAAGRKDLFLLFRGIAFDYYKIGPALLKNGVKKDLIRDYDLILWRSSYIAENPFKYSKLPGSASLDRASAVVMIDAPCGPDNILPDFLLNDIANSVQNGARLVIFGGLFTLGKGEFQRSALAKILPVKLQGAWQVKGGSAPLIIKPVAPEYKKIDWSAKPAVYYYHDLKLTKDANVLLAAGGKPLLVSRKFGKGEVIVFLGSVCGSGAALPFWQWRQWPKLAAKIIRH